MRFQDSRRKFFHDSFLSSHRTVPVSEKSLDALHSVTVLSNMPSSSAILRCVAFPKVTFSYTCSSPEKYHGVTSERKKRPSFLDNEGMKITRECFQTWRLLCPPPLILPPPSKDTVTENFDFLTDFLKGREGRRVFVSTRVGPRARLYTQITLRRLSAAIS